MKKPFMRKTALETPIPVPQLSLQTARMILRKMETRTPPMTVLS